ncbi:hypothetical protein A9995_14110 [Erythrobacter sp. QSSC1-22B]|uniref:type IV secretion system protein n=1 Tax=Erythrobacter sp. QSSC1-22B TaxID=1860125 RepID=UPI000804CCC6|nr:type IV secretion system protein [Erythrobacter sp. QSSC1-22B]OBX17929.1 hypothetical protein A9995_14110 [Erythrobacter sp. QSSC1-22B]
MFDDHIFSSMYQVFVDTLNSVIIGNYAAFVGIISGPLRVGMVIYIILLGYAIMRGAVSFPFREYVYRGCLLAALYFAVTSLYGATVANMIVTGLPNEFSSALGGPGVDGAGEFFDRLSGLGLEIASKMATELELYLEETAGTFGQPTDWSTAILGPILILLVVAATIVASAVGFVIVIFATFALALLAVVGPLFIAALLFDSTRGYFFAWLGSVINYIMLIVFALLLTVIATNASATALALVEVENANFLKPTLIVVAFYTVTAIFYFQIPAIAAGLGGGSAAIVTQFGAALSRSLGATSIVGALRSGRAGGRLAIGAGSTGAAGARAAARQIRGHNRLSRT